MGASPSFETTIVIPAFNEESRLGATLETLAADIAAHRMDPVRIAAVFVVDDGSGDRTAEVAAKYSNSLPGLRVIRLSSNRGKGFAVRTGIIETTSAWCLIADADMSTPWNQAARLATADATADIRIGSRDLPGSEIRVSQSFIREHMGKTFNLIIRLLTGLPFKDTQCGFKLIRRAAVEPFVAKLAVDRFAWDVEFLLYAFDSGLGIKEIPVVWAHQEASRVHPIWDSLEMLFATIKMRIRKCFQR